MPLLGEGARIRRDGFLTRYFLFPVSFLILPFGISFSSFFIIDGLLDGVFFSLLCPFFFFFLPLQLYFATLCFASVSSLIPHIEPPISSLISVRELIKPPTQSVRSCICPSTRDVFLTFVSTSIWEHCLFLFLLHFF